MTSDAETREALGRDQIEPIKAVVDIVLEASLTDEDDATVNAEADRLGEAIEALSDPGLLLLASTAAVIFGMVKDEVRDRAARETR